MSLGKNFLSKLHRRSKPRTIEVSLMSLLETYEPVLRTLKLLSPTEVLVAADVKQANGEDISINIYTKKEVQSRTRKD